MSKANIAAPEVGSYTNSLLNLAHKRPWENPVSLGVSFTPSLCDVAGVRIVQCGEVPAAITPEDICIDPIDSDVFTAYVGVKSGSFNIPQLSARRLNTGDEWEGIVREAAANALERCKAKQVENEFWTGAKRAAAGVDHQSLVSVTGAGILSAGTSSVSFREALMVLNDQIAENSSAGKVYIHMPAGMLDAISDSYIKEVDGRFYTKSGHLIVPGQGYTGAGPTAAAADDPDSPAVWIYATSPVVYYESEISVRTETDSVVSSNNFIAYAERTYATAFDPCVHYAIRVDMTK